MNQLGYYVFAASTALMLGGVAISLADIREQYLRWEVHDEERPLPPVVDPGHPGTQDDAGKAPSDAIVLFDGESTDALVKANGEPIGWRITEDGALSTVPRTGNIQSKQSFGDIQLHVEWRTPPSQAQRGGQGRGNSGIFLMGKYEIQVLDNKDNDTYADGMAGSIYGQRPPMVNPGRGINQWQTYDIIWRAPRFDDRGNLVEPAYVTVLHNGVLVQNHTEVLGPSRHKARTQYTAHQAKLPIVFQNHGEEAHYRNIWVRELPPED
ncbi:MAG: DUF1080 domain-containing protein [Planctomycetota bacterium]